MTRAACLAFVATVLMISGPATACGWWGENQGAEEIEQVVVGGADDGIDLETPEGMAAMSRAYRIGNHVPKDLVVARLWAGRAAKAGHVGAMNDYAQYLERGLGGPEDLAKAAEWFSQAAEAGNANAQHSLANLYFDGRGLPENAVEAERWLRTAARAGHASASAQLASMIWAGRLTAQQPQEACLWWLVALRKGMEGSPDRCTEESPDMNEDQVRALDQQAAELLADNPNEQEGSG